MAYKNLSYTELRDLYMYGQLDDNELIVGLLRLGYHPSVLPKVLYRMKTEAAESMYSTYRSRIFSGIADGYISEEEGRRLLVALGLNENVVDAMIKAARLDRKLYIKDLLVAELDRKFREGEIDEAEYRSELAKYIVDPELIEARVRYNRTFLPKDKQIKDLARTKEQLHDLEVKLAKLKAQLEYLKEQRQWIEEYYNAKLAYYYTKFSTETNEVKKQLYATQMKQYEAQMYKSLNYYDYMINKITIEIEDTTHDIEVLKARLRTQGVVS